VDGISSTDSNSGVAYTLFRILIDTFAALAGCKTCFRFNVATAKGQDDYEKIPEMDDIEQVLMVFEKMTKDYNIEKPFMDSLKICGDVLKLNLK
jgi:hypothetical protein